jgi:protease-4
MPDNDNWERNVIEKLALAAIKEQRRARQWGVLFKLLTLAFLFLVFFAAMGWFKVKDGLVSNRHTAMVDIHGVIALDARASAENVIAGLRAAFEDKSTQGVILRINSPGGSPVQAGQINDEILRLKAKYPKIPLYAVVEEICASGAYYIASAADRIYVDKASLVGSIGVLMDGFGFTEAMNKVGVERRLLKAGENKGFLDSFSPMTAKQKEYAQQILDEIHQQFIGVVKKGRGTRLKETPELFSGLVWNGQKSIEMGLADSLGSVDYVAREIIKATDIVDFTQEENFGERLARRFGTTLGKGLGSVLSDAPMRLR